LEVKGNRKISLVRKKRNKQNNNIFMVYLHNDKEIINSFQFDNGKDAMIKAVALYSELKLKGEL
jgi:hypothetical protein